MVSVDDVALFDPDVFEEDRGGRQRVGAELVDAGMRDALAVGLDVYMASIDLNGDDGPSAGDHDLTTHRASSPVGPSDV